MKLTIGCGLRRLAISFAFVLNLFTMGGARSAETVAITTYHYDNDRTGWNRAESTLTPANVGHLRRLAVVALDEQVDAQPLIVPGVTIAGGRHNVLYVVTENNTIYALDAASGAILLH
jgi:hypothetical protein